MKVHSYSAFTAFDVVILFATLFLLMALLILAQRPARSPRIQCVSNEKQIALAFRMWANDHGGQFPMAISSAKGGSRESALAGDPVPSFVVISNELNSPKVLLCQQDTKRGPRVGVFEGLAAKNISYLIGIDANETNASAILTADRNIGVADLKQPKGLLAITDPSTAQWSTEIHNQQGNIALADGSAFRTTQDALQKALKASGLATNRFVVP